MANTYTLIASNTLSSSAASVTFSSIPNTYTDLLVKVSARSDFAGSIYRGFFIRYNGSSATNYSYTQLYGDGASGASQNNTGIGQLDVFRSITAATATSNTFGNLEIYIPNYNSSANKTAGAFGAHETNGTTAYISANAFLRSVADAITSLDLLPSGGNFVSGSSFFLYGIKNS